MCQETKTCRTCKVDQDICRYGSSVSRAGARSYKLDCNGCQAIKRKAWRAQNPEKVKAATAKYDAKVRADPDATKRRAAQRANYRLINIEEIRAKDKLRNAARREQQVQYLREYYAKQKERFKTDPEYYRKFREAHNRAYRRWISEPENRMHQNLSRMMNLFFRKELHT